MIRPNVKFTCPGDDNRITYTLDPNINTVTWGSGNVQHGYTTHQISAFIADGTWVITEGEYDPDPRPSLAESPWIYCE